MMVAVAPKVEKSVFDTIPSKVAFFSGLAAGIMVFATIGFILMLVGGVDLSKLSFGGGRSGSPFRRENHAGCRERQRERRTPTRRPPPALDQAAADRATPTTCAATSAKAKVALVEYSDYECPYCKQFQGTMQQVVKAYGTGVAWIYRYFPLSFHQNAEKEAEAAECVAQLGGNTAFWNFSDKIYERTTSNGTGFALTALGPLAKEVGVDQSQVPGPAWTPARTPSLVADEQAGGEAAGIGGTPGTLIITGDGRSDDQVTGAQSILPPLNPRLDALLK